MKTERNDEKIKKHEKLQNSADFPKRKAELWHPYYRGKIEVVSKVKINSFDDFAVWHTPGVVRPCEIINNEIKTARMYNWSYTAVYDLTNKWNNVGIVSDGSKVPELGHVVPEAAMPLMEGKALLFKHLGGIDAFPICLNCHDADEIISTVKWIQPSFGGINLEDIAQPKCFKILDTLHHSKDIEIPVWHDNQQGTATIIVAGIFNSLKYLNKKLNEVAISMVGAGAINIAAARVMVASGIPKKNIIMIDSKGILHPGRKDIEANKQEYDLKWDMCINSNGESREGDMFTGMKDTDMVIAASKPGPGIIKPEYIQAMAADPIVFACANPIPEIWPWEAKDAGAVIIATSQPDFPNQINNNLGFPGIFRGTLDVMAMTITTEMCIAAAKELAEIARDKELEPDSILPSLDESEVFPREAMAVGQQAIKEGIARLKINRQEAYEHAEIIIKRAREETHSLMDLGYILEAPEVNLT
jgi:malate dehydrogenase (oxaloacetate-decarboxylating)